MIFRLPYDNSINFHLNFLIMENNINTELPLYFQNNPYFAMKFFIYFILLYTETDLEYY
jgi:hypothetical protein